MTDIRPVATTAILGTLGAIAAQVLSLPAPYLIGPAALVTVGSLMGFQLSVPHAIRSLVFLIVGLSMGAGVTPEVVAAASAWPFSFITLIAMSFALLLIVYAALRRAFGYDPMTSMLAACPGHLSYVLSLAAGVKSDLVSVGVIQSVRVLALTLLVPLMVDLSTPSANLPSSTPQAIQPLILSAMAFAAYLLGRGLQKLQVPAALLVGGMIGSRFSGVSLQDLRSACLAGLAVTGIAGIISAAVAFGVSYFLEVPLPAALIAFAPGGLETMAAMAVILHADPAYVGTHHIVRLIFLSFLMPAMIAWVRKS